MDVSQAVGLPPTCSLCKSFIDVRQGNRYRCSCGKVTIDAPQTRIVGPYDLFRGDSDLGRLINLLNLLRAKGVARFEADGLSLSFHEPANVFSKKAQDFVFEPGDKAQPPPPDEEQCTCGHKILTDHNEQGCLHGCALDTCGRESHPNLATGEMDDA